MTVHKRLCRAAAGLAALVTALTAATFVASAPAQAAPPSAMDRCLSGAAANQSETVTHNGNQYETSFPAGVHPADAIWPGDVVRVTAIGSITNAPWPFGGWFGPAGNAIPAGPAFPYPGMNEYSSIARWNASTAGWYGDPMQTVKLSGCVKAPPMKVRLIYHINDSAVGDNGGAFTIKTDLFWGP